MRGMGDGGATGIFDGDERLKALSAAGDPLERLAQVVDFKVFRGDLAAALSRSARAKGGRPASDAVLMFKVLVLQTLYTLSDDQTEYQLRDRWSFMRFVGLALHDPVPDAKTIWLCQTFARASPDDQKGGRKLPPARRRRGCHATPRRWPGGMPDDTHRRETSDIAQQTRATDNPARLRTRRSHPHGSRRLPPPFAVPARMVQRARPPDPRKLCPPRRLAANKARSRPAWRPLQPSAPTAPPRAAAVMPFPKPRSRPRLPEVRRLQPRYWPAPSPV